ncbi:YdcF family protein [Thermobispora bispora]|uniref:DUF218 domain-containing protein n=1 Tax=Thermobispora bispora (strain ATCC 19993 / DSM 43833 / CBS 139.67 / JCM 10125 / KCTC 9307 / NBRC 14880 / R51) TaxID=469371 RepID=D6Y911_THEBD|nr:protein of unknown function DUF218 [Thermobispora bispora DSM 43833]MBO2475802.1 YdcF family protein [Actinomycetales bacterium]QSI46434.1 YdcF family protein [Thermobispora bispora]QSI49540.1 YdcF family protein [Thermobispora bispora]
MRVTGPLVAAGLVGLVIVWAELVHWRSSRRLTNPDHGGTEAVVVLGYRNPRADRANALNRWRVRAGLRSIDPGAPSTRLILSGGPYEALVMARYATEVRGYAGEVVCETESRGTWENVRNVIPYLEDRERIKIVSNPLHAEKARRYLWRQRPDLAARLVPAADYRPGEWAPLKPFFAAYGLLDLAQSERRLAARNR